MRSARAGGRGARRRPGLRHQCGTGEAPRRHRCSRAGGVRRHRRGTAVGTPHRRRHRLRPRQRHRASGRAPAVTPHHDRNAVRTGVLSGAAPWAPRPLWCGAGAGRAHRQNPSGIRPRARIAAVPAGPRGIVDTTPGRGRRRWVRRCGRYPIGGWVAAARLPIARTGCYRLREGVSVAAPGIFSGF